ncbi:MAG: hypothetical protein KJ558_01730 [Gammaproteobacteria bacterium]|nr:hypothetical protein [Gammaproteobacteria bacterium]MBU1653554.1 hypothetical protein [Gammaproteobacteria bacterium]MBU1961896.1 hypothetical protein [Gammaproteobacteria bacterium]
MERPRLKETLTALKRDAQRYGAGWATHAGFWVGLSYRIRRLRKFGPFPCRLLLPLDLLLGIARRMRSDSLIAASVPVGPGLYLPHPNGVFVNPMALLGADVALFQQVSLAEWQGKAPVIGDGSSIFAGAKVIGGVRVGRNCKIGANVVLTQDVPDDSSVAVAAPVVRARGPRP